MPVMKMEKLVKMSEVKIFVGSILLWKNILVVVILLAGPHL